MTRGYAFYEQDSGISNEVSSRPLSMKSLMTKQPFTLAPNNLARDAITLMQEKEVRHIPIVDPFSGRLEGLVTEADILRNVLHGKTLTKEERYHATLDMMLPLKEVMVRAVLTLPPEATVAEAVTLFLRHKIRCAPVVDDQERLLGIVTETDLMRLMEHMVAG